MKTSVIMKEKEHEMKPPLTRVNLLINNFDCRAEELSSVLGLTPSETWRAGEQYGPAPVHVYKESGWQFDSPLDEPWDVPKHLWWILDQLPATLDILDSVTDSWAVQVGVRVEIYDAETPVFSFEAPLVRRMADIGASLDIDYYFFGDEDEEG